MYRQPTYENLFEKFLAGVEKTKNVDYLDRNSIRENNMGVDQYRKAAKKISELYPERVVDFASLLDTNDTQERICCAVCVLEFMSFSKKIYEKAYSCIMHYIEVCPNGADRLGFEVFLQKYPCNTDPKR